jgi:hypothetical protein
MYRIVVLHDQMTFFALHQNSDFEISITNVTAFYAIIIGNQQFLYTCHSQMYLVTAFSHVLEFYSNVNSK